MSQCFLGPSSGLGLQFLLLKSGGLLLRLLRSVGHLLHRGGLLFRSGGFLPCLLRPGGLLPCLLRTGGLLLRHGSLLSRLLRIGGLLLCLLRRGGLLSGSGGLLLCRGDPRTRLLFYGGPQLHPFCRLHHGPLFCRSCLSPKVLHLYMDLALPPSPCSASAPPPSWICVMFRASGNRSLGGGSVMNSVHGLPFARHQRSLFHHIDSHTTQTVPHYLALQFP